MQPATGIRVLNAIQCLFWVGFGLYFAFVTTGEGIPYALIVLAAGAFMLRGLSSGGLALFRPGTRASIVSALAYLLSAWPLGLVLLAFAMVARPVEFGNILMGVLGALFVLQALRSQPAVNDLVRLLRTGQMPAPPGEVAAPAPEARGPPVIVLLWGLPFEEAVVEDEARFRAALREGSILLIASEEGRGSLYVGVVTGELPGNRFAQELPREAVIRDPGTSQAFRSAGLKGTLGRAIVIHKPALLGEVPA